MTLFKELSIAVIKMDAGKNFSPWKHGQIQIPFEICNFIQAEIGHRLSVPRKIMVKININTNLNGKGTPNRDGWYERKPISSQRRILLSLNKN